MRRRLEQALSYSYRKLPLTIACVIILYLALAAGSALAERPYIDEGMFASPGLNLATKGFMGTTVLETTGSPLKNIRQRTYWVMPLFLVNQGIWYKIFGFSLFSMRAISIMWGLVGVISWFLIVSHLSGNRKVGLLAFVLIALDYTFLSAASLGRMDMMSAALGFAALAAYLSLRERNLKVALLTSQALVVASGLTHPNGIMPCVALLFLTLYYDRHRIGWRHVLTAALPYLVGAIGEGLYILQDPSAFQAQFIDNVKMGGRMSGFSAPWVGFVNEFTQRYPHGFGLGARSAGHSGPVYLKSLILIGYAAGILGAIFTRRLRQDKGVRALLVMTAIYFVIMSVIDGQKETFYLVHIVPFYLALLAVWVHWCWTNSSVPAPAIVLGLCGLLTLQAGGIIYRAKKNTYQNLYVPAITFLKHNTDQRTFIAGSSALGFGLNFPDNLVDDPRFGYTSGKKPDILVFGEENVQSLEQARLNQPELYQYITRLLATEYRQIYENPSFKIYARL